MQKTTCILALSELLYTHRKTHQLSKGRILYEKSIFWRRG